MNNILNIDVTFYKGNNDKTPVEANLYRLLTGEQHEKYKGRVQEVRNESDPIKRKSLKSALPMYAISGVFSSSTNESLLRYSSLIGIDIDKKDNEDVANFDRLKELIRVLPFVAYCGHSVGGQGYFCIIPIAAQHKHVAHYKALELCFKTWGLTVDSSGSNVCRRRFVSYDSEPYINPEAEVFKHVLEPQHAFSQSKGIIERTPEEKVNTARETARMVCVINDGKIDITGDYKQWFEICCALANEFGEPGRVMFHIVSKFGQSYDCDVADKKFDEALKHEYNYSIGTFFRYANQHGVNAIADFSNITIDKL